MCRICAEFSVFPKIYLWTIKTVTHITVKHWWCRATENYHGSSIQKTIINIYFTRSWLYCNCVQFDVDCNLFVFRLMLTVIFLCSGRCWLRWWSMKTAGHSYNQSTVNTSHPIRNTSNKPWTLEPWKSNSGTICKHSY